jgi:peptidoglycan/xylan/chitin deacetylase (PgdA/CDA1 family)
MTKPAVRARVKQCMVRTAVAAAAGVADATGALRPLLRRPRVQALCFHHLPAERAANFRRLIELLRRDHVLIGYDDAIARIRAGAFDGPALAFTFDDGLHSQVAAAQVLEDCGVRGCFFVCPSMLDRPSRESAARFCRERLNSPPRRFIDWDDAAELLRRGHEIGCHTLSHADLSACSPQQLDDEIGAARQMLVEILGRPEHFAWPFGRWQHVTADAVRRVFDAGFATCASAERGCHDVAHRDPRALCIRRTVIDPAARPPDALPLIALSTVSIGDGAWPAPLRPAAPTTGGKAA